MTRFWGTHSGKLDKKGRVAVPAPLRSLIEASGSGEIAVRASHQRPCIEARSGAEFNEMMERLARLQDFDLEDDALLATTSAEMHLLRIDGDGRVILPAELIARAGLNEAVVFLGKVTRFEIWDEAAGRAHLEAARARVAEQQLKPPPRIIAPTPQAVP